jgi:hypothetical protein
MEEFPLVLTEMFDNDVDEKYTSFTSVVIAEKMLKILIQ